MMSISSPLADPTERRLALREAIRPLRGAGGADVLRAPFRPASGQGEAYVWLCRRIAGPFVWPAALCLAEVAPSGEATLRGEIGSFDFLTIYGARAFIGALAVALDPRAASQPPGETLAPRARLV